MGKTMIRKEMFPEIVECYNHDGRQAAHELLRNKYGISNTYSVIKRIKESGFYNYDGDADKFSAVDSEDPEGLFMNLEELCRQPSMHTEKSVADVIGSRTIAMEKLVHELVSDRLLALSRYIVLDTSTRTIMLDQTSLVADGYQIVTH